MDPRVPYRYHACHLASNILCKNVQPAFRFSVLYGCFRNWWYPQNTPKWSFLVGKPHGCWGNPPWGNTLFSGWCFPNIALPRCIQIAVISVRCFFPWIPLKWDVFIITPTHGIPPFLSWFRGYRTHIFLGLKVTYIFQNVFLEGPKVGTLYLLGAFNPDGSVSTSKHVM